MIWWAILGLAVASTLNTLAVMHEARTRRHWQRLHLRWHEIQREIEKERGVR